MSRGRAAADERLRWESRYGQREESEPANRSEAPDPPEPLARMRSVLPARGRAVDLAGGDGGGGLFLARRGLDTTVVDISPIALERASTFAAAEGLELTTVDTDLAGRRLGEILELVGDRSPAVVTCFHYLSRPLLTSVGRDLPAGCRFVVSIMTTADLRPDDRRSSRFLLGPGELAGLVLGSGPNRLRVLHRREGWAAGRHRAELTVEASGSVEPG